MNRTAPNRFRILALSLALASWTAACGDDPSGPEDGPLTLGTTTLAPAQVGQTYSASISASGGDGSYAFRVSSGALPPGLSLSAAATAGSATLSGTPTEAGDFTFDVTVASGGSEVSRTLTLSVTAPPVVITTGFVPPTLAGRSYSVRVATEGGGGTLDFSVVNGSLPAGLSLSSDGVIQGTATQVGDTATFTVRVQSGSTTDDQVLRLIVYREDPTRYDITPFPVSGVPPSVRSIVDDALAQWQRVIVGDLAPEQIPTDAFSEESCATFGKLMNGAPVDDMLIAINADDIDGPGGTLAFANTCAYRDEGAVDGSIPVVGFLTLDIVDLESDIIARDARVDLLAHEIGHALGFGTIWSLLELIDTSNPNDPLFNGSNAAREYATLGGSGKPPLENVGVGTSTRSSHWRQSIFGNELMTGFLSGVSNPLSRLTVGSMEDLGYTVDYDAADPYKLGGSLQSTARTMIPLRAPSTR